MSSIYLAENLLTVKNKIYSCAEKSGRELSAIKLIAVSKTRELAELQSLIASEQTIFGENTIQDAMTKIPNLSTDNIEWHFIGHLQSKKAGKLPGYFQWIHTVDSIKLARKLSTAFYNHSQSSVLNCLLQVNITGEETKSGLMPTEVKPFIEQLLQLNLPCLRWRGLMTIGIKDDELQSRHAFSQLRKLQNECKEKFSLESFDQLSMGMSNDYCLAIEEGATMVRVGTSIFGEKT